MQKDLLMSKPRSFLLPDRDMLRSGTTSGCALMERDQAQPLFRKRKGTENE